MAVAYFTDPYSQSVLISIGSALFLFSLLTYFEPRLIERIGASFRLVTLNDVQAALRSELDRPAQRAARDATSDAVGGSTVSLLSHMNQISNQLQYCGFKQCDQTVEAKKIVFRDQAGLGIEWVVSWDENCLRHTITSKFFKDKWSRPLSGSAISRRKSLMDLQDHVDYAMRRLALKLVR